MKNKKQLKKIVRQLIEESFREGKIVESQVVRSIKILKSLPRHAAIQALSEYLKSLKRKEREHTMYIETTTPLSPAQIKKIKKIVEKKVKVTKVLVNINPELLGGFQLRIGDEVWDDSVIGRIMQIKEAISKGHY